MSYVKAWDVVAYTYRADNLCPPCTLDSLGVQERDREPESIIEALATARGIDYGDAHSYDSGEFPKPVFASQIDGTEHCGNCGKEL